MTQSDVQQWAGDYQAVAADAVAISLRVNGIEQQLTVKSNETLLEVLREKLGLTGAKTGCNQGECGACTVLMEGDSVVSCLLLAVDCQGLDIRTVEGLEDSNSGALDPLQEAFVENFGTQCGYCTPGMLMSAKALLQSNPEPSVEEIKEAIQGNLCRCTGYHQIVESIQAASRKMQEQGHG